MTPCEAWIYAALPFWKIRVTGHISDETQAPPITQADLHYDEHVKWKWMAWSLARLLDYERGAFPLPCSSAFRVDGTDPMMSFRGSI